MIEWLRSKFSSLICVFFVLTVIFSTIKGAVIGSALGSLFLLLGLILGFIFGLLAGILVYGFLATVINISESLDSVLTGINTLYKVSDSIDYMLRETAFDKEISEIKDSVNAIKNTLRCESVKENQTSDIRNNQEKESESIKSSSINDAQTSDCNNVMPKDAEKIEINGELYLSPEEFERLPNAVKMGIKENIDKLIESNISEADRIKLYKLLCSYGYLYYKRFLVE